MVPFLYWFVARRSPGRWQIIGAVIATVGLGALSLQGDFTLKWGDAITLLGTLLLRAAHHDHRLLCAQGEADDAGGHPDGGLDPRPGRRHPFFVHVTLDLPWQVWAAVVWTAISGTIYAFFIQSWAQRYTTSTHAAILLGFESVFAALAGIIAGMDTVTCGLLVGGSLMLTGVFVVELLPGSKASWRRSRRRKGRRHD